MIGSAVLDLSERLAAEREKKEKGAGLSGPWRHKRLFRRKKKNSLATRLANGGDAWISRTFIRHVKISGFNGGCSQPTTFNQLPLLEPFRSDLSPPPPHQPLFFRPPRQFLPRPIESGESRAAALSGVVIHSARRFISGGARRSGRFIRLRGAIKIN